MGTVCKATRKRKEAEKYTTSDHSNKFDIINASKNLNKIGNYSLERILGKGGFGEVDMSTNL